MSDKLFHNTKTSLSEESIPQKEGFENLMLKNINEAEKLPLSGDFESGIISAFIT